MFKKLAFAGLGIVLLITPTLSSAQSLAELQAQVQALLAQLNALQAQIRTQTNSDDAGRTVYPSTPSVCVELSRNLYLGLSDAQTNGEVGKLQQFLISTGDYTYGEVTGYFGPATEQAVKRWQSRNGVVSSGTPDSTGYGAVGPSTRTAMARACVAIPRQAEPSVSVPGVMLVALQDARRPQMISNNGITIGMFTIDIRITNIGDEDIYIPLAAAPQGTNMGAIFRVIDRLGNAVSPGGTGAVFIRLSGGTEVDDHLKISSRTSASVRLQVQQQYTNNPNEPYRIQLATINWKRSTTGTSTAFTLGSAFITPIGVEATSPADPRGITVLSPNGGEQWEIGQLNTITWAPYTSIANPSKDVVVHLMRPDGTVVGRIMDTGKASLHTYFNIDNYSQWATPGQYYVTVKNTATGATDKSDALFTLLPRAVDLKVNDSDTPITVSGTQSVTATWATTGVTNCHLHIGGGESYAVSPNGSKTITVANNNQYVALSCNKTNDGSSRTDYVYINPGVAANLNVVSPNGKEAFNLNDKYIIQWQAANIKNVSIALYKNDQWFKWIWKDVPAGTNSTTWRPADAGVTNTDASAGAVYKIYITGQKADGTGYVDDKSNAPFSFAQSQAVTGMVNGGTFSTNKPTITGTANNTDKVGISIDNGDKVYGSGSTITVGSGGNWSHTLTEALANGTYNVQLYSKDSKLLGSAKITIQTGAAPVLGTYRGYMSGNIFIETRNISEVDALTNCKKNANDNPTKTIRCTWNDREIYRRDGVGGDEKEKGTYRGYINGVQVVETPQMIEADALADCKTRDKQNPNVSILCIWKDKEIYRRAAPTTVTPPAEKATLLIRLNGAPYATVPDITQADALVRCKALANNTPEKKVECKWKDVNIYERAADTSKNPTCTLKVSPSTIPSGGSVTVSWVTTYADWVKLDDGKTDYGSVNKDGSKVFTNIKKDTTFTLRVDGKERVNCAKTVKVSTSSSMGETENLASALSALEAATQALLQLLSPQQ